ncbi:MAG: NAD(P)-binding domain-containing protein, partial [Mangrovimonas sp.]|nr:NAD(P)-binding domain-containing protein [Mangrovimonas sp.]
MIQVVLLGAGNVANHFYKALKESEEVQVVQWYNRQLNKVLGFQNETRITDRLDTLLEADVYIMAVNDDAIHELSSQLPFQNRLVVHTSGSVGIHD